jgi:hypothetical protein
MVDIIDSSFSSIDSSNLIPSFFSWLFGNALSLENGSIFGVGLVLLTAMVSFLSFKGFRYEKAMVPSAFITWIVALFSLKAGWINNTVFVLCCIYAVVAMYYLWDKSSDESA